MIIRVVVLEVIANIITHNMQQLLITLIIKNLSWISFGLIRRLFDILVGSLGLLCSVPFIVVFGLLTKIEDGGPVFYKQERVGLYGKHFTLYKLRSMRVNAEKRSSMGRER